MFKKILFIFVFLYTTAAYGQNNKFKAPDYDQIEKNIEMKNTAYYYPDLLKKLKAYDTLLTREQYTHLYYGYMFQDDYELFPEFSKQEELERVMKGDIDETERPLFISLLQEALEENPLDLSNIIWLGYAYKIDGQEDKFLKVNGVLLGLLDVINSSGDGRSCESAFHTINPRDSRLFIEYDDLEIASREDGKACDFYIFDKVHNGLRGWYFNNSQRKAMVFRWTGVEVD